MRLGAMGIFCLSASDDAYHVYKRSSCLHVLRIHHHEGKAVAFNEICKQNLGEAFDYKDVFLYEDVVGLVKTAIEPTESHCVVSTTNIVTGDSVILPTKFQYVCLFQLLVAL